MNWRAVEEKVRAGCWIFLVNGKRYSGRLTLKAYSPLDFRFQVRIGRDFSRSLLLSLATSGILAFDVLSPTARLLPRRVRYNSRHNNVALQEWVS